IAEMVVLIRPKTIRDRKTKEVVKVLSPAQRGEDLLRRLWLTEPEQQARFRFVAGDVEQPDMGLAEEVLEELKGTLTHVIHCAASVAFDDPYEDSFRANVTGTLNALAFSYGLQTAPGSPFIAHLGIETSYIHGRQTQVVAREDEMAFPRNFYNNYYELTKAMASIETERYIVEKHLRVTQLCPAIVIGETRAGNNRGDTKVVNAPVNVFGRAHQTLSQPKGKGKGTFVERSTGALIARMACIFPGDPSAELNLIPVDWVVLGILSALKKPEATGRRVHLATDNRLTSKQIRDTVQNELGVDVKLAEPTLHRNVTLPALTRILKGLKQDRIAHALDKLGTIFGGYSEWGQPIHEVGRDVSLLGMPEERPNTLHAFRMLCRHNRYVQNFGQVRDEDEISRREKVWWDLMKEVEETTGSPAGAMEAPEFHALVARELDLDAFERKAA
ncbi:MAG: SDR family oxidoreductase, partial [Acidobacteria bacterium]|nr:SDR family oxidoreductase [Acidobacteriota bacterium]